MQKLKVLTAAALALILLLSPVANAQYPFPLPKTQSATRPEINLERSLTNYDSLEKSVRNITVRTGNGVLRIPKKKFVLDEKAADKIASNNQIKKQTPILSPQLVRDSLTKRETFLGRNIQYHLLENSKPQETIPLFSKLRDPIKMIGVWKPKERGKPERVVLRWSPNPKKNWIPETGYDLYRIVGGKRKKLLPVWVQEHM